jgi:hypothetical protein
MSKSRLSRRILATTIGGAIGLVAGYLLYILMWWVFGWLYGIFQPQYAFIYQRPPDPGPHVWWVLIGGFLGAAIGYFGSA